MFNSDLAGKTAQLRGLLRLSSDGGPAATRCSAV